MTFDLRFFTFVNRSKTIKENSKIERFFLDSPWNRNDSRFRNRFQFVFPNVFVSVHRVFRQLFVVHQPIEFFGLAISNRCCDFVLKENKINVFFLLFIDVLILVEAIFPTVAFVMHRAIEQNLCSNLFLELN